MERKARISVVTVLLAVLVGTNTSSAQNILKDARGREYLADRVIVKLKRDRLEPGRPQARTGGLSVASPSIRSLLAKWRVIDSQPVFPHVAPPGSQMRSRAARAAAKLEFDNLGDTFTLTLPHGTEVESVIADFLADTTVAYAEPVYVFRLGFTANDPLFSQQWYLNNTGQYFLADADVDAPEAWDVDPGSLNVVVAIIDSGVDLDHPDLSNQIWQNVDEQPGDGNGDGRPGFADFDDDGDGLIDEDSQGRQPTDPSYNNDLVNDDDENGYEDDFLGWNWIDDDNDPQDDHGHGTHCAGIAAAETDNGVGIAGVCPGCRIMAVKAFQSSGTAASDDIAAAIHYAYKNGAGVLSMSFSSRADATVLRNALEVARSTSVLTAAAGNDGRQATSYENYPAAYSFVVGVGASDVRFNVETGLYEEAVADFSNVASADIFAPGVNIRSTLLDDTYAAWSGTSMATPIVAGIAGLLASQSTGGFWGPDLYHGQLINSGEGIGPGGSAQAQRINALLTLSQSPEPHLTLESYWIDDSGGDGDGIADAGETIDLYFVIRNIYGDATGVTATLSTTDSLATVLDANADYASIGPSASDDNTGDPITVAISPAAGNNRDIVFTFQAASSNGGTAVDTDIVLTVERGIEVSGEITENQTWSSNNLYLVTDNIRVLEGVTLTIEPGTRVQIYPGKYIRVEGSLRAIGLPDDRIVFTRDSSNWGTIGFTGSSTNSIMEYCTVEYGGADGYNFGNPPEAGTFMDGGSPTIRHCVFRYNLWVGLSIYSSAGAPTIEYNYIGDSEDFNYYLTPAGLHFLYSDPPALVRYNTIAGNSVGLAVWAVTLGNAVIAQNNIMLNDVNFSLNISNTTPGSDIDATNNYWGSTNQVTIADSVYDYEDNLNLSRVVFDPFLTAPVAQAPAVVAGLDMSQESPVGAGDLTVTATFSRPMRPLLPNVTFGPTSPFTQHAISGQWVSDTVWQGSYDVSLFTGDGLQKFRISGAQDLDFFDIPVHEGFDFEIITAGLSGVNLQASGEAGGVDLFFNPVDEPEGYD